jgi:hypothetical protein
MTTPVEKAPVQDTVPEATNGGAVLPADLQDERLIASHGISGAVSAFTSCPAATWST